MMLLLPLLGACGGKDDVTMPPLTPEPSDSRFVVPSNASSPQETLPARLALYKYLRGVAAGNVKSCAYLTPEHERRVFGAPGRCRSGLARARAKLGPRNVAALRGVTVPVCAKGSGGDCTVRFEDLRWKGEPASPGGLLAASFTLRKTRTYWQIAG
ncbi:hypothetical protein ACQPZP_37560 [Spirillospora sp. CA-142024]|uniref:hypothetical protein n=1 Tax=Spirillospora sp. CA-142024 TaxID=3240036 RepID=UPI003D935AD8